MKTCAVCDQEISSRMIRQGGALSRGNEYYHRDCHRSASPGPSMTSASAPPMGTSYPDLGVRGEAASFLRRLGAHILDGILLNLVVLGISLPLGVTMGLSGASPEAAGVGSMIGGLIGFVLPIVYYIWFWSRTGATPGKKILGVVVVNREGNPPTGTQSFVRYLGYIVSSIPFCLGFLWMLWDSEGRTWHDMMAGTRVIRR